MIVGGRPRILVVEDNRMMATLVADVLDFEGYEVVGPASTVKEGEALAEGGELSAAVVDYNLDGHSAAPLIWRLYALGVPIIVLSGMSEIAKRDLPLGITFLAKGPSVRQLIPILQKVCP